MMPARILVFGGRDYADQAMLFGVLDMIDEEQVINVIIQGDCPTGADRLARMWAISRNHHYDRFPPDWTVHGRAAGPIRNQQMIDEGKPTMGIAFPGGRGTADMLRRLKAAGIPTQEIAIAQQMRRDTAEGRVARMEG